MYNVFNMYNMAKQKTPRGIRNNNPLNIRRSRLKWEHEVFKEPVDYSFCQFDQMKYGWRAAFCLFRRYIYTYGVDTIQKIISRWAPSTENNTKEYINRVAIITRVNKDEPIDFRTIRMLQIAAAMCWVENGYDYYPMNSECKKILTSMCDGWMLATSEREFIDDPVVSATIAIINEMTPKNEENTMENEPIP